MDRRKVDNKFKVFDATLGKIVRLIESSRVRLDPEPLSVHHRMVEMALDDSADFALKEFGSAQFFKRKGDFHDFLCEYYLEHFSSNEFVAEFGVYQGDSINYFAKKLPAVSIFGFDSFFGLPEEWWGFGMRKGSFDMGGRMPQVEKNVKLIKGLFQDTLPTFLKTNPVRFGMINFDADLYQSTIFVLNLIETYLQKGAILIFDEFYGYVNWRNQEYRAFVEWSKSRKISYEFLAYTDMQVAVRVGI